MRALGGRNAAILSSLSASRASDGLDARIARAHRANARASPIDPSADLARRAARLRLGDRICSTSADSADIRETVMCPARGNPRCPDPTRKSLPLLQSTQCSLVRSFACGVQFGVLNYWFLFGG